MGIANPVIRAVSPVDAVSPLIKRWAGAPAWVECDPIVLIPRRSAQPADAAVLNRRSGVIRAVTSDLPRLGVAAEWEPEALFAHVWPRLTPKRRQRAGRES